MVPSIQSFFSLPSSATGRVEKATSRLLISPDLMMNLDICNSINLDPWKAKASVKAVKMRLQNKNSNVQYLALTLLETMIKKCDDFVHYQVIERRILPEMARILRKSKNMQVRHKVLVLLESWQEAFHGPDGRYPQFYDTYAELKKSGVQFPGNQKNADLMFTPTMPITNQLQIDYKIPSNSSGKLDDVMASATFHFSLSDLDNIRTVMDLFVNVLKAVPDDHKAIKDEVIADLSNQCDINQKKLVRLINSTENDKVLVEALSLNDSLQDVLSKHGALVAGSSPLPETSIKPSTPNLPPPLVPEASDQFHNKKEEEDGEEEDGFSIIANRNSNYNQDILHKSTEQSNAMILFEPQLPVSSEEDMIDLVGLTLSPATSQSPPPPLLLSSQNQHPISGSPSWEHYLNHPQPFPPNEDYNSYNSSIAPWPRPAAVPQFPEMSPSFLQSFPYYSSGYLPPPWPSTAGNYNPFLSAEHVHHPGRSHSISETSA